MTKEEMIRTRVDQITKEKIRKEAEKMGISESEYIRKSVIGELPKPQEINEILNRIERKIDIIERKIDKK